MFKKVKQQQKKSDISLSMELFIRHTLSITFFKRKTYAFLIPRLNTLNSFKHTYDDFQC